MEPEVSSSCSQTLTNELCIVPANPVCTLSYLKINFKMTITSMLRFLPLNFPENFICISHSSHARFVIASNGYSVHGRKSPNRLDISYALGEYWIYANFTHPGMVED
jgi:hypothetical protein